MIFIMWRTLAALPIVMLTLLVVDSFKTVELTNKLRPGVTGKDVIVALCGHFNKDEVLNCAVEFTGEGNENFE